MKGMLEMKETVFFAEEIEFTYPGEQISDNEISELDDFPGKEDFIDFYTIHNGLNFAHGAWFFPEKCYNISLAGDPYITLDFFLSIPVNDDEGLNIEVMKDLIVEKYDNFEDFVLFHIPFALDVVENPFWIDTQTGEIKYTDFQVSSNPDDAITVATSFKAFCKCITNRNFQKYGYNF